MIFTHNQYIALYIFSHVFFIFICAIPPLGHKLLPFLGLVTPFPLNVWQDPIINSSNVNGVVFQLLQISPSSYLLKIKYLVTFQHS